MNQTTKAKLFVDDLRDPPDADWTLARTAKDALSKLNSVAFRVLSLDHDLGDDRAGTGYTIAAWLEEQAAFGRWDIVPDQIMAHTANPAGCLNIQAAIDSIDRMRAPKERIRP